MKQIVLILSLLIPGSGRGVAQVASDTINGWYLARIEGGTAETYSAIVQAQPLGSIYSDVCQAFHVRAGPGTVVVWKKNLGKKFKVPRTSELLLATDHNRDIGANLSSFPSLRFRIGNADTMYGAIGNNAFAPSSYSLAWFGYGFMFEWPAGSGNIPQDSVDRLEFQFSFESSVPDSVVWYFGALDAYFDLAAPWAEPDSIVRIDWFGNTPPPKTLPPPVLMSPHGEVSASPQGVLFTWHAVAGSTTYGMQVGKDSTFSSNVFLDDSSTVTNVVFLSRDFFEAGTAYYWRARTRNEYGWGPWSEVWTFWLQTAEEVKLISTSIPTEFALSQNYPNPFNPSTTIEFSLPRAGSVGLKIFNLLGEKVETLIAGEFPAGRYSVTWDATGKPSGIYFCLLQSGEFSETKKVIFAK